MTEILKQLTDFDRARETIIRRLQEASLETENHRVGFVSGLAMSEGPLLAIKNIGMLKRYTRFVKKHVEYPVYSVIDFLKEEALIRVLSGKEESQRLWREVLQSGYVTDIFMAPKWEQSHGSTNEHRTAKELEIQIHSVSWKNK